MNYGFLYNGPHLRGGQHRLRDDYCLVAVVLVATQEAAHGVSVARRAMFLVLYVTVPAGLIFSLSLALTVGRVTYGRRVRSLLLARAPRVPGASMRCRACGGDLVADQGVLVRCGYCGTHSLAAREIIDQRVKLLRREEESFRQRSISMVNKYTQSTVSMNRTLIVCVVLTYASLFFSIWIYSAIT